MMNLFPLILFVPALLSIVSVFVARTSRVIFNTTLLISTAFLGLTLWFAVMVLGDALSLSAFFHVDALSALMLIVIGIVGWGAAFSSVSYLAHEERDGDVNFSDIRRYIVLSALFTAAMIGTVIIDNLGLMWTMLEATTLASTLLVAFYRKKGSLEAAWKYLVLCSTGLSLGLFGFLLLYMAGAEAGIHGLVATSGSGLLAAAETLPHHLLTLSFVFILIGFGTKVGLVPMHTWLPDAHGRAPSPISGLLSGAVLNIALFAILRFKAIVDAGLGSPEWTNALFLAFGVFSVIVPAVFILAQTDYKRLLAYSSIEHMGLIVFSWGLGGIGIAAAIIHILGHALSKSMLFFAAGNILNHFKSTKFDKVSTLKYRLPITRSFFVFGLFALLAAPPSPLFFSEYLMILAAIKSHPVLLALLLIALVIVFAGFLRLCMPMLFGTHEGVERVKERWNLSHVAMGAELLVIIGLGVVLWTDLGREFVLMIAQLNS